MSEPKTSPRNNGEKGTTGSFRFEQQILNTSSIGVLITRINDGTILYANKAISSLLGNSNADSIVGQPVPDFYWDSTDREKLLELFRAEGSVTSKETRARQADGNMIWVSISLQPFEFEGEQVLLSEIIDISERKHVENEVKESQQKLALLIDSSPLAVIEWNTNFEVVSWNLAAERIFGYTAAEAKGKHARFIIPPEFHMYVDQVWEGLITQTGGARATNANVTKNGQAITCEWYNSPLAGADGKVFGVSSLVEDVTERKQAEDTVKESQQKLSLLIDSSPLAFIEWDMNFEVVSWNPSAERIFGYTAAEAKGKHARFIIPPEFHMYVDQVWEGLITQTGGTRATNANVTKNGQAITSEWYNTPLVGTDGKVLGVSSLVEDITERKQAEEELQRIQIIAETVPDFIAIASPDRSVLYVNSAGLEITGKTAEEVSKGIKIEDFQPTLSPEALKAVETEGIWKGESELVRKDGSFLPVSQVIATSKDSEGNVQYITTLARDITERKLAEEKLLQLQSAVEQTGDGIALADLNGNILYVNPAWAEVHGYTVAEILGQHLSIFHTPQQLEQEVIPFNNRVMSEGKSTSEVGHARKDGTIFPTLMTTVVQKDENGNPVGLIGTIRDITENKKAEELLQQSETNLSSALRVAQMGYWEFDVPTQTFTFNDQYYSLLGTTAEKAGGYQMSAQKFATEYVPPEDAAIVQASIGRAIEATDPNFQTQIETRNLRADGTPISTTVWFRIGKDAQNQTVKLYGVSQDITERKQAEERLNESEVRYQLLSEATVEGIVIHDKGILLDANGTFATLFGYKQEEAIGMSATDFLTPETREITAQNIRSGYEKPYDVMGLRKDGSTFPVEITGKAIPFQGRMVRVTALRDITERKQLEQQVQEGFERRGYQVQVSTEISQEVAAASGLNELFGRVVTLTKERLGYYHTQLLRYDSTQDAVVLINGYGETGQKMLASGHRMPLGSGLIGTAASSGETILRSTLAEDPDWQPNPLLPDTQGEIAVPIKLGEQVLGVLDIQSDQAGDLTEDDRLLLEGLCGQIAVAIEQTRLRQEMTERLEEVNRLYQSMSREGWKNYRNTADLPTGFVSDREGTRLVNEETADEGFANIPMRVLGGEIVGTLTVANDPKNPTSAEDYAFFQQVSDQIALALEGARLSAQTQFVLAQTEKLFEASRRLAQATDLQELVKTTVETLNIPVVNRAILGAFSYNAAGELENMTDIANWWNGTGHEVAAIGTSYSASTLKMLSAFLSATPVFFNDTFHDERMGVGGLQVAKGLNIRAGAVLPLFQGSRQLGILMLQSEEPHNFSEDETRLFTALAPQIATVMENRRQYQEAQNKAERETTLNVISQKIQSATTVEAVLQIAARELGHALGAPMTVAQLSMKDKE